MSDVKTRGTPIELGGRTYELVFNLNVLEEICDKYGDLSAMIAKMGISGQEEAQEDTGGQNQDGNTDKAQAMGFGEMIGVLGWLLTALINEALDIAGDKTLTEKQVKRMILPRDIPQLKSALIDVMNRGMPEPDAPPEEPGDPEEGDIKNP